MSAILILHHSSFLIKVLYATKSNALQKSNLITLSLLLLWIRFVTSSKKTGNFLWQSLFSINPGWLALIALFSFNAALIEFSLFSCFILPWTAVLLTVLLWTQVSLTFLRYCHNVIFFSFQPFGTFPVLQELLKICFSTQRDVRERTHKTLFLFLFFLEKISGPTAISLNLLCPVWSHSTRDDSRSPCFLSEEITSLAACPLLASGMKIQMKWYVCLCCTPCSPRVTVVNWDCLGGIQKLLGPRAGGLH